jgi:hypothetical protein
MTALVMMLAVGLPSIVAAAEERSADPCRTLKVAHLAVWAGEHRVYLCGARGTVERSYPIRLASEGVGKSRAGDGKLPLGAYALGAPRPSDKYGTFIPIGYPTPEQQRRGYTGGSVGVHGPDRRVRWLGRLVNTFDTTDGCVGLASDGEMAEIARWVRRTRANWIVLHEQSAADAPGEAKP